LLPALLLLLFEVAITTWPARQRAGNSKTSRAVRRTRSDDSRSTTKTKAHSTAA
jgi:hypothetical protein